MNPSFKGYSIVACGTMQKELNYLKDTGFLDADKILYTTPGLHENLIELEKQLKKQIKNAKKYSKKILVVYGYTCYLPKEINDLIKEEGGEIYRIKAQHCVDMLADIDERKKISNGKKAYFLPVGWFLYRKVVFKNWDKGMANETFPKNDKAVMLDAFGIYEEYLQKSPEDILEFSDWMGIPFEPYTISLDRFKNLLIDALNSSNKIQKNNEILELEKKIDDLKKRMPAHSVKASMLLELEELEEELEKIKKDE